MSLDNAMFEGFGQASIEDRNELVKALTANEGVTDIANLQQGSALQPQSLETSLALLTFSEKSIRFFKDIGITKAFSTLEEYTVQDGYGAEGGFVSQVENPEEGDPDFRRAYAVVKYIRTLWKVADVLQYTRTITGAEVVAKQAAMMRALRITERNLFFGDSALIPQSFDGLEKTILTYGTTQHVIDLRGGALTESVLKQAAELISSNFGVPTDLYLSNSAQTAVDNLLVNAGAQRFLQENVPASGAFALGHAVEKVKTSFGIFNLKPDIFINPESQGVPTIKDPSNPSSIIEGPTAAKAPATPSFALTINAPTVSGSLWKTTGDGGAIAGAYQYRVVAINQYGKSAAAVAQSTTVAASGSISVVITAGVGAYAPTAFEIYRETAPGSGKIRLLHTVAKASTATTTFEDKNDYLSGASKAFLVDNTSSGEMRTMALSQLAPIHSVEYAKISPVRWGAVNFYITPKWYAPLRYILFRNVGIGREARNPVLDM